MRNFFSALSRPGSFSAFTLPVSYFIFTVLTAVIFFFLPLSTVIEKTCHAYGGVSSAKTDPDASSIVLLDYSSEKISKNFSDTSTEHEIIKILNKKGIKKYSSLSFPFSNNQKLKVYYIKIVQPDGAIININPKSLKTVTAPFNPEAPIFSNQMLNTVQLPGLEKGSTINYKFSTTQLKPYMKNNFFTEDYFGGLSPLAKSVYTLTFPRGIHYNFAEYGFHEQPEISYGSDTVSITWSLWNRNRLEPEIMGPGESFIVPHVTVSSVNSWDDVASWYAGLTVDRIKPGKILSGFINKITAGKKTGSGKIKAIYNFVTKKVRYVGYEFGIGGYEPSDVNTIFKNRFGDCKDHATLFSSMLTAIGVKSYPVLVPTSQIPNMNPKIPTPFVFDHEITAIRLKNGKLLFADTTSNVTSFGDLPPMDQGRNVLVLEGKKGVTIKTPVFPASKNYIDSSVNSSISNGGVLRVKEKIVYGGAYDMYKRYLYSARSAKKRKDAGLEYVLNIVPGAKLTNFKVKNGNSLTKPYVEKIGFEAKNFPGAGSHGITSIRLPLYVKTELTKISAIKQRKYRIEFGYNFSEKINEKLKIPKNYEIVSIPIGGKIKNSVGSFTARCSYKNNTVFFSSYFSVNGHKIPAGEYADARKLFSGAIKILSRQVIFVKS